MTEERKIVLITGTSRGIGKATAEHLKAKGYIVYGSSRSIDDVGDRHLQLEVTDPASCQAAVDLVVEREGRLDVLVNNVAHHLVGAHEETSLDEIHEQFDVNFFGAVNMIKAATPYMLHRRSGAIVNMISVPGEIGFPFMAAYSASKFALNGYAESLRMELVPFGITVSNISPAGVKTGTTDQSVRKPAASHPLFADASSSIFEKTRGGQEKGESSVKDVASAIERAISSNKPLLRYRVGVLPRMLLTLRTLLSQRRLERFVMKAIGAPTKPPASTPTPSAKPTETHHANAS